MEGWEGGGTREEGEGSRREEGGSMGKGRDGVQEDEAEDMLGRQNNTQNVYQGRETLYLFF